MQPRISCLAIVLALFLCLVPGQPAGAATEGAQAFDKAVEAFRAGDYDAALRSFLAARRAGLDTPGLRYNLGATYYRLQRYAEAASEFQALARDPQWTALAHYNLGLTAQRMGHEQQARAHFDQAHRSTADPNLRALAGVALERLDRASLPPRTGSLVSLAGGYDSNVAPSTDAATVGSRGGGDFFAEALAATSHNLSGSTARGWNAHGAVVLRKYSDLSEFDLQGLQVGVSRDTDSGRSQISLGGHYGAIYLDGRLFEQSAVADMQARTRLDAGHDLRGRYQLGRIDGGGGFRYLDGWQHRLSVDAGFALAPALLRVGYQFELNNRRDLQQGGEFFSYSPTRHSLFATVAVPSVGGWQTDVRGEYRASRYKDPYRLNGGTFEVTRQDDRYGFELRGSRGLSAPWRVFIDYSYYRNESNLNGYDYGRYQLLAGFEAMLETRR